MKLYLSSYRIPTPDDLAALLGKPLRGVTVRLFPTRKIITCAVPCVILPMSTIPELAEVLPIFRNIHKDKEIIELKGAQAVVFDGMARRIVSINTKDRL